MHNNKVKTGNKKNKESKEVRTFMQKRQKIPPPRTETVADEEQTRDYEKLRDGGSGATEHVYAIPGNTTRTDTEDTGTYIDIIPEDNPVSGNSNPAFHSDS